MSEFLRLDEESHRQKNWKRWGPYLTERQWATVREDYSANGDSWDYFTYDDARSRAYRWGEDGILGICDRECRLSFSVSLWNGKDDHLKERLFGLTPKQGNHGEDVKELYYYLDSTPTHSYMKALYKYPQSAFPYQELIRENQQRGLEKDEYEILDTGVFNDNRYFDIFVEYAKASPNHILIRYTIHNRGDNPAELHFLPTLVFRNNWSRGRTEHKPHQMSLEKEGLVAAPHPTLGNFYFECENATPLFTENESNRKKLFNAENITPYTKDAFHEYLVHGKKEAVNLKNRGSKFGAYYHLHFQPQEAKTIDLRLYVKEEATTQEFDEILDARKKECDEFYAEKISSKLPEEEKIIARQAYAGLLWSKQFYYYVVREWLEGDPSQPIPPKERLTGRNSDWKHFFARDVISMPDKWEYPWFAAWDLGFHMIPFAKIDPVFAKKQLILFLREWYMHANGALPSYEYDLSDVNPPVHAWACWRVYKMTGKKGERDVAFLESAFQKLLINFTWWVNRKDAFNNNLFSGGFLGLDNIGVLDRSQMKKFGGYLEQSDATAWMAFYCLTMLSIALELATHNKVYEDMASKFFEHFIFIADAMNEFGGTGLWNEEDGFFYDKMHTDHNSFPLKTRSLVGLIPLIAVIILEEDKIQKLPGFSKRITWFLNHRADLERKITYCHVSPGHDHRILAIPTMDRLKRILRYLLDETEFLSPFGIRSLSKYHDKHPYTLKLKDQEHFVKYLPGVSNNYLFGGNSNWRGPVWMPINYLIIEALERYDHFYGDRLKVECPVGSGKFMTLKEVANELNRRLCSLFQHNAQGNRPCFGEDKIYAKDNWDDLLLFHEYFHAETGKGLGASHQTGWTALIAKLLEENC